MMKIYKLSLLSILVFGTATFTFAATATTPVSAPSSFSKTYHLLNIKIAVANDPSCKTTYQQLKTLAKKPLQFQFTRQNNNNFAVNELNSNVENHSYQMINESVNGAVVTRLGMGTFTLQNQPINYVISITADTAQATFNYLYPVILSSHEAHCYFTALLKPNSATQKAFKQKVQAGMVTNSKDLENK